MTNVTIWWLRRDLRLADQPAVKAALGRGDAIIPLFILDPVLLARPAEKRQGFLFAGLRALDADLRRRGSYLVVRAGEPGWVLSQLLAQTGAQQIIAAEDYSRYAIQRDQAVSRSLPLRLHSGVTLRHPAAVLKPDGAPYTVFTPYSKAWKAQPLPDPASLMPAAETYNTPTGIASEPLPEGRAAADFPASEAEAQRRLDDFCTNTIYTYHATRNGLDDDGTSRLSPYLRFGMLSARQAVLAALAALNAADSPQSRQGIETWVNELIWREFYASILYHFPTVLHTAFNPSLRQIPWRHAPEDLQAWQAGLTGYPVVDAGMRQLVQTGWMHNRARMIVASFLVKDLLINWQEGEAWFMRLLVDGDPAANNGGWQWTAGTGTDAAPYFRIFNPVLQGEKFDPAGSYIRRWVPELAAVPNEYRHRPWELPEDRQRHLGIILGRHYPAPIVDRNLVRQRTLAAYQASKQAQQ